MHYLLFYDVVPDYVERRVPFRAQHLALARAAHARCELLLGGALADPVDGAVLLFQGESPAVAEAFAAADPYVRNGLVTRWRVRTWTTVVGDGAAVPVSQADQFFDAAQQQRLAELMARWRTAQENRQSLSAEEQRELKALIEAEVRGSAARAEALADK